MQKRDRWMLILPGLILGFSLWVLADTLWISPPDPNWGDKVSGYPTDMDSPIWAVVTFGFFLPAVAPLTFLAQYTVTKVLCWAFRR